MTGGRLPGGRRAAPRSWLLPLALVAVVIAAFGIISAPRGGGVDLGEELYLVVHADEAGIVPAWFDGDRVVEVDNSTWENGTVLVALSASSRGLALVIYAEADVIPLSLDLSLLRAGVRCGRVFPSTDSLLQWVEDPAIGDGDVVGQFLLHAWEFEADSTAFTTVTAFADICDQYGAGYGLHAFSRHFADDLGATVSVWMFVGHGTGGQDHIYEEHPSWIDGGDDAVDRPYLWEAGGSESSPDADDSGIVFWEWQNPVPVDAEVNAGRTVFLVVSCEAALSPAVGRYLTAGWAVVAGIGPQIAYWNEVMALDILAGILSGISLSESIVNVYSSGEYDDVESFMNFVLLGSPLAAVVR